MIASSLKIMLWDKEIGRLSWDARRGVSFFEYNPAFLGGRLDPFPLVASVKSPASRRPIMGDWETKLYRKLPPSHICHVYFSKAIFCFCQGMLSYAYSCC